LPNHYLIFTLSSELLANKVVIKIFQNYGKIVDSKKIEAVDMVDKMFEQEETKD